MLHNKEALSISDAYSLFSVAAITKNFGECLCNFTFTDYFLIRYLAWLQKSACILPINSNDFPNFVLLNLVTADGYTLLMSA